MTTIFGIFQIFSVGLWPMVKANVLYVALIAACVVWGLYGPIFKKTAFSIAIAIAAALFSYHLGARHEYVRMEAQRVLREQQFNVQLSNARKKAVASVARRNSGAQPGWLRRKPAPDKYDRNP